MPCDEAKRHKRRLILGCSIRRVSLIAQHLHVRDDRPEILLGLAHGREQGGEYLVKMIRQYTFTMVHFLCRQRREPCALSHQGDVIAQRHEGQQTGAGVISYGSQ
jgi:hypothetical protein